MAGVELLLREQLEHVGERLEQAVGADAVGAEARLEAAEQLALEQQDQRHDLEHEDEDHDRLDDLDERALEPSVHQDATASRRADLHGSRRRPRRGDRGRRCRPEPCAQRGGRRDGRRRPRTPRPRRRTPRRGAARRPPRARRAGAVERKRSDGECSISGPVQSEGADAEHEAVAACRRLLERLARELGRGQRRGGVAVLPAHAVAADLVEREPGVERHGLRDQGRSPSAGRAPRCRRRGARTARRARSSRRARRPDGRSPGARAARARRGA